MLVEDDDGVRQFASTALEELGYTVYSKENGIRAIEFIQETTLKFDLLITDLIMPELNGKEMINRLEQMGYHFNVLFTSGYTDSLVLEDGSLEKGVDFLQKPYTILELSAKIREILDRKS